MNGQQADGDRRNQQECPEHRARVARVMISVAEQLIDVTEGIAPVDNGSGNRRCRPEILTGAQRAKTECTQRQISEGNLLLERIARRLPDAGCHLVRPKRVSSKSEYAAGADCYAKPV